MEMFDSVVLLVDLPDYGLKAGDVGAIVEIFVNPQGLMIEFNSYDGDLVALPIVDPSQVRPMRDNDIASVRPVTEWYGAGSKQDMAEPERVAFA